ncbi:hypothetical protein [Capnocytophaga cynodegmi]|uniref:Putative Structural protein n=1 Tax=Capnocytophaga cynodegmi TaxID=28189 RepID=A0A0B7HEA7_9FLAO|nr:hypothetical protein [Capnocytophaga cynodegmi]CEN37595.1 putative Structural protein [Capnocytophaga cynodegmi]
MKNVNNILSNISDFIQKNPMFVFFLVLLYFLRSWFRKLFPDKSEERLPEGQKDFEVEQQDVSGATLTRAQATTKAEHLFQAMDGIGGTDEQLIYNTLRGLSNADYNMIYNAFGVRYYNSYFGEKPLLSWFGSLLDLNAWIVNELSVKELQELKRINPELPF